MLHAPFPLCSLCLGRRFRALVCLLLSGLWLAIHPPTAQAGGGLAERAPPHQLHWRQWTVSEGLPQITVNDLVQDPDGFLWLGTQDGVSRFDGVRFDNHTFAANPALGHSVVNHVCVDRDGGVWLGTMDGVARVRDGRVVAVVPDDPEDRPGLVLGLSPHPGGGVLVGTRSGLFHAHGERVGRVQGVPRVPVAVVVGHPDGSLVAFGHFDHIRDPLGTPTVTSLRDRIAPVLDALATDEGVWLGTQEGLVLIDAAGQVLRREAMGREVQRIDRDAHGVLWLATDQGLWSRAPGGPARHVEVPGIGARTWLRGVFVDREGSLWVGTQLDGLQQGVADRFRRINHRDGLSEGAVWSVMADPAGVVWAGTPDGVFRGGLEGFDAAWPAATLPHPMVLSVEHGVDGTVWVGTRMGLARVDPGDGVPRKVPEVGEGAVGAVLPEPDGSVLIGAGAGLFRVRGEAVERIDLPDPDPSRSLKVNALVHDKRGRLWVGYDQGLAVEGPDGLEPVSDPDLAGFTAISLTPLGGGRVLATGFEGVVVAGDDGVRPLGGAQGLPVDAANYSVVAAGRVWLLSVLGIASTPVEAFEAWWVGQQASVPFTVHGGAGAPQIAQCNGGHQNAGLVTGGRWLWCPSLDGLLVLDLDRIGEDAAGPDVVIEWLSGPDGRLAPGPDRLTLPATARDLSIQFTAMTLRSPGEVRFQARLVGYDSDWLALDTRRTAFYTNLPPGAYRFEVRAVGPEGAVGSPAGLDFSVAPFWHETVWARLGLLALAIVVVLAWVRHRTRALQRDRARLERRVQARTRELAAANQRLAEASVTDALTGLHNRRHLAQQMEREVARADRLHADGRFDNADVVILHIDLDHFKRINDTFGHAVGDQVLVEVGRRLKEMARATDFVLRWGGEEFLLIGVASSRAHAAEWARRVGTCISQAPVQTDAGPVPVTCSIGHAAYPLVQGAPGGRWEDALELADVATYAAKREGRNRQVGLSVTDADLLPAQAARLHEDLPGLEAEGRVVVERSEPAPTDATA